QDTFTTMEIQTLCAGESIEVFGQTITESTTVSENFTASNGCDSLHTIEVIFLDTFTTMEIQTLCAGESIEVFGQTITEATTVSENFIASNGCDSLHTVEVIFLDTFTTMEIQTLCAGEIIEVFGQTITEATTVSENFTASNGCDSLHTVEVIFLDTFVTMEIQILCAGESIEVFGQTIMEATTVSENFTALNGCDSLHTVEVIFLDTFTTMEIQTLCAGESIEVFGQTITEATTVSENFTALNGCDSLHMVEVVLVESPETFETLSICEGDTIEVFGQLIFGAVILSETFNSANGCDSIHTIEIELLQNVQTSASINLCEGAFIEINGQNFTQDTTLNLAFMATNGCDSIHQINLSFAPVIEQYDSVTLCENEFVVFFGDTITNAGFYDFVQTPLSTAECDTVFFLTVSVESLPDPDISILPPCPNENDGQLEIIDAQSNWMYSLDGTLFQSDPFFNDLSSGDYQLWVEDDKGCFSQIDIEIPDYDFIAINLLENLNLVKGDTVVMPVSYTDTSNLQFSWTPSVGLDCANCPFPNVFTEVNQTYELMVTDSLGCVQVETINITIQDQANVFIPNAFSPNGDDFNDRFTVFANSLVAEVLLLQIFDRWGEVVFDARNFLPNDELLGWDGTLRGKRMMTGVYVYRVEVRLADGSIEKYAGDVTLME
ncbi:MAG: gliding motility-associated C-terminal domain-containing protein, partial [Bacteroidota bacterium]